MKILIVDDSETEITLLKNLFESESDMEVVGIARNGNEAVRLAQQLQPDLITMDILMPEMDGFEATKIIMSQHPIPIVVISGGVRDQSLNITFKALEAGALSVMEKPAHFMAPDMALMRSRIIDTVRAMAEIKVIKRRFYTHLPKKNRPEVEVPKRPFELVAIGTSVGGPQALKTLLSALPEHFPVPIVIVQHMTPGFIEGFAKWMDANVRLTVRHVKDSESLSPGTVYFAPDYHHLEVHRGKGRTLIAKLVKGPPVSGFCPSATVLLKSVAETCGKQAIGVLLTGMGSDGSQGLLNLRQAHGHTLIQDKDSAVVFGMGGVAQSLGAVDRVVNLEDMAAYLTKILL